MLYLFAAQSVAALCCLYAFWRERENHHRTAFDRDQACGRAALRQSVIDTMTSEIEGYKNERADLLLRSRNSELRVEALEAQIEHERVEAGKINKARLATVAALQGARELNQETRLRLSSAARRARQSALRTEILGILAESE